MHGQGLLHERLRRETAARYCEVPMVVASSMNDIALTLVFTPWSKGKQILSST
jgi:hypothetical protein